MSNPLIVNTRAVATGTAAIGILVTDAADVHNTTARGTTSDLTLAAAAHLYADNIDYYTSTIGGGATFEPLSGDRAVWDTAIYYNRHASDIADTSFTYHSDPLHPTIKMGDLAGGDLTGTYPNPTLVNTGPGATGPIGSATVAPIITIDAQGRITALSSAAITGVTPAAHQLDGALHTVSGETPGYVLTALTATTFGFAALPPGGAISIYNETIGANGISTTYYLVNVAAPGTIRVHINGIRQPASDDATATDVVTFSTAPALGALLMFDYEMEII